MIVPPAWTAAMAHLREAQVARDQMRDLGATQIARDAAVVAYSRAVDALVAELGLLSETQVLGRTRCSWRRRSGRDGQHRRQTDWPGGYPSGDRDFEVRGLPYRSPSFLSRAKAEAWLEEQKSRIDTRFIPRVRACLSCAREFASDGAHNRLCNNCRHAEPGPVAMSWARPQRRGEGGRA